MMMDSCLNNSADRGEQVEQDELQRPHPPGVCTSTGSQQQSPSVEDREHLQVYLRIRPFTSAESSSGESQDCVSMETPDTVLLRPPSLSLSARLSSDRSLPQTGQRFTFSQVYGPDTTQRELFAGTVKDLVKDVLQGGNSLVFTYGVTNAGKTFTFLGPDADAGILPRSLALIFNTIDEQVFPGMSIKPHRCREFVRLSREQQAEEVLFKRSLFKQLKETERINSSISSSTNRTLLEAPSVLEASVAAEDRLDLEVDARTKFSVWVSFCEIYNENIHDLLESTQSAAPRRTVLRLSQDVKGNAFVKDLRWVQVTSAEEAYMVMKLGKKNQSFSSTRLNQLSSRSHSIFSIRILRIEDVGTPRVHTVSELCLCDLAGSERCAKTQNKGERLKEAGNINTSLLILGKCINALRHNQQAKLLQHVPFRESKLTHYLQSFFCGRGKACMIVNINQCASMYDETLSVLKFSAVAQKVVVLSRPPPVLPQRSTGDTSFVTRGSSRRSSMNGWESSLEDVQEDEGDEEDSLMDITVDQTCDEEDGDEDEDKVIVSKKTQQRQVALSKQLQLQLKKERAENLLMEARVREEISREFSELFSEMQNDYNERLAREREILEERAERRLEIFKNLINNMSKTGADTQVMDKPLDSFSSELAGLTEAAEAAHRRLGLDRAGRRSDVSDAADELERKVLELNEQQRRVEEQTAGGHSDDTSGEEKRRLLLQLQEKSSLILQLEKRVEELQKGAEPASQLQKGVEPASQLQKGAEPASRLQEVLTALEEEKKAREDALTALEYQTMGKEEALASLEEERKAREETLATAMELRRSRDEVEASLEEQRRDKENAKAALEEERRSKEEALAALEEARSTLESEKEEGGKRQQEAEALQQEVRELVAKLKAAERQVTGETERTEQALVQLQAAQNHLDQQVKEKTAQIQTLTLEAERLRQELQRPAAAAASDGVSDELREEVSELRRNLSEEKQNIESNRTQVLELERELQQAKEQLAHKQQLEELNQKLQQQEEASRRQIEELREKLQEQQPLDELRSKLEDQEVISREVDQLRAKLDEQTQASEKQLEELNEKLQEEKVRSHELLEELQHKLTEQKGTSDKLLEDLKQKFSEQEKSAEQLEAELEEAKDSSSRKEEELKKINSDLQAEVASLRATVSNMEEMKEAQKASSEVEKVSAEKEAELRKKLLEAEAQVKTLQKNLREVQERREEEESQAVQEARRREAERRRELLAVAHEAIAQKDEELEKRAEEINRLKENSKQDAEKVKSLAVDLQRKEDDTSDLREKLADYKKQIQQVQKEISAMRDEEKVLKQKLSDVEKTKKQLQSDVASRDRTIQQLKLDQSSEARCEQSVQLYQQSCKDLEAKQRLIDAMRLALTEQEETQEAMEKVLEEKVDLIQELSSEVDKLKALLLQQDRGHSSTCAVDGQSDDLKLAKQEAARAQESLKLCTDKHQAERKKWLEEKLSLIGQAKEAEDKRNQDMRKFADDRERYNRQQSQLESLTSQLAEKDQTMERWRTDRDALVAALEVQLQKLLSSQAEKDKVIQELQQSSNTQTPPPEGGGEVVMNELRAALQEREVEIQRLKEELKAATEAQVRSSESPDTEPGKPHSETLSRKSAGKTDARASVSSQGSAGCPSVLDSSEISTENGRTSRFPRPELEISFSPLQPNRMALRRQGEESAVTVKITRSARKRKSGEMEKSHIFRRSKRPAKPKEEVEAENRRNTRTKVTPKITPQQEESSSPAGHHDSHSSVRSRKEGTLQKIGDFLQSSPTLLGSKAKKMMSLVSGRGEAESASTSSSSSSSLSLRAKKNRRKLYRPEISSPMDLPSHPIISREPEEKDSDHQIIKRRLRSRMIK